jgi:hypothetical protein
MYDGQQAAFEEQIEPIGCLRGQPHHFVARLPDSITANPPAADGDIGDRAERFPLAVER